MNRGDFINYLKKGDVIVLGTCTGCAGMLHNQGTTNGMYIRGNEKRVVISLVVKSEIENYVLGSNLKTYIKPYVPMPRYELSEEEKEDIAEDANFKRIFINVKDAKIEYGVEKADTENDEKYNNEYIIIDDGKNQVKRCIKNTTYGNKDRTYRTTYYFGGNIKVNNKNYGYIVEGIEFSINGNYVPSLFVIYAIRTDELIKFSSNGGLGISKKEELERLEEIEENKKKKDKNKGRNRNRNRYMEDEYDEY